MTLDHRHVAAAAALVLVLLTAASNRRGGEPVSERPGAKAAAAVATVADWPERPRVLAAALLEKYGAPEQVVVSQLSWRKRGPWARIVLFRDPDPAGRPVHLLESVAYGDPHFSRWPDLSAFAHGTAYDAATRELSARTDAEETNVLALNLADEVLRGRRTVSDARGLYDSLLSLSFAGKTSPYMTRLLFKPRGRALPKLPAGT